LYVHFFSIIIIIVIKKGENRYRAPFGSIWHSQNKLRSLCIIAVSVPVPRMCVLRKPCIRSLYWYDFKTHYFSAIDMIIKTKQMFFLAEIWDTSCKGTVLFWKREWGTVAHLHLKRHAQKQPASASTQNRHFQKDIIIDLSGIFSWNFTYTFWGPLRIMALFHCMVQGFLLGTVPGTWYFFQYHLGWGSILLPKRDV